MNPKRILCVLLVASALGMLVGCVNTASPAVPMSTIEVHPSPAKPGANLIVTGVHFTPRGHIEVGDITIGGASFNSKPVYMDINGIFAYAARFDGGQGRYKVVVRDSSGKQASTTMTIGNAPATSATDNAENFVLLDWFLLAASVSFVSYASTTFLRHRSRYALGLLIVSVCFMAFLAVDSVLPGSSRSLLTTWLPNIGAGTDARRTVRIVHLSSTACCWPFIPSTLNLAATGRKRALIHYL